MRVAGDASFTEIWEDRMKGSWRVITAMIQATREDVRRETVRKKF